MADDELTWYVVPTDKGWLVIERTRGGGRRYPTRAGAIAAATDLARAAAPASVQVRRTDGTIERQVRIAAGSGPPPRRNTPTPAEAPTSKLMRRSRLLLVDDDPLVRASFGRMLSARGWEVILAEDCDQALGALGSDSVFAAIIDVGLNGSVVLAEKLQEAQRAGRIVFFTGAAPEGFARRHQALGEVVVKGSPDRLLAALAPRPDEAAAADPG